MNKLLIDFRYAFRLLAKTPMFTLLTILVLAGGTAISVFTFSFLNTAMFKDLPLPDSANIVKVYATQDGGRQLLDAREWRVVADNMKSLEEFVATENKNITVAKGDIKRSYLGVFTQWSLFKFSRTQAFMGRLFTPADQQAGAELVTIMSYRIWESQYNKDPAILDKQIEINGSQTRVVGVMPQGYEFPVSTDFWLPINPDLLDANDFGQGNISGFARIKEGFDKTQVISELTQQLQSLRQQRTDLYDEEKAEQYDGLVQTLQEAQVPDALPLFIALMSLAGFITLLAAINVGNLLLARTLARRKEIAVRVALGAPGKRLVFQMMLESVIITIGGGLVGLVIASWGLKIIDIYARSSLEGSLAFWWQWGLDLPTVFVAIVFIALNLLVVGWLPTWRAANADFNAVLRDSTRGAQGRGVGRLSRVLVVLQVVLISVVLFTGGVLAVSTTSIANKELGFDTNNALVAPLVLDETRYTNEDTLANTFESIRTELLQNPAIRSAMVMSQVRDGLTPMAVEGVNYARESDYPEVYARAISTGMDAIGVNLKNGRWFDERDSAENFRSAMVSASLAQKLWPNGDVLSGRLRLNDDAEDVEWATIVGVVSDTLNGNPMSKNSSTDAIYFPLQQSKSRSGNVVVKYAGTETAARTAIYDAIELIDPELRPDQLLNFDKLLKESVAMASTATSILLQSGLFAMILAITGIYGITANSVVRQTQEIGVRRALGATDSMIIRMLMLRGAKQLFIGVGIAGVICALLSMLLSNLLIIDSSVYVMVGIAIPAMIITVVMVAIYTPANKAVGLAPANALRFE